MKRTIQIVCVAAIVVGLGSMASAGINIETVRVGNAGNAGDTEVMNDGTTGYGTVNYVYDIGKYEVTTGQYTEFLNAVAETDAYGLYSTLMWSSSYRCRIERTGSPGSYSYSVDTLWANRPVNFVGWGDAARFANWLHNGQPTGLQNDSTTEDGAYCLNGATTDAALLEISRESDWKWAITSEDEWYKAAFHKNDGDTGNYFDYPTGSDSVPGNALDGGGNNATFYVSGYTIGQPCYRTEAGAHENSDSPYGTFDQGGNVWEWNQAIIGSTRGLRGGSFGIRDYGLHASTRSHVNVFPTDENYFVGFRVSEVPEPATLSLLALGGLAVLRRGPRR